MEIFLAIVLFIVGILLIIKGGDVFVDAASWIAEASGIPKFIIGATIVSLATTLPELLVSAIAASQGKVDMAIGNAVGSVTANLGLIMAISIVFLPGVAKRKDFLFKGCLMSLAILLVCVFSLSLNFNVVAAIVMILLFLVFIVENVHSAKKISSTNESKEPISKKDLGKNSLLMIISAIALVIGSDLLVDNASLLASLIGISEGIIAVTIVAIGTSLPELVTTLTAIAKKQSSLSIGNIIGANIIDLSLILPICTFISGKPLPVSPQSAYIDMPICLIECLLAIVPTAIFQKFQKWQGFLMILVYIIYLVITCTGII